MNKKYLALAAAGIIVIAGVVAVFTLGGKDTKENTGGNTSEHAHDYKKVNACETFTLDDAKSIMGPAAAAGSNTADVTTDDINVSTCSYTNKAMAVSDIRIATVAVRSALSDAGIESNEAVFGSGMPEGAQMVDGYGDKAYFDASLGQLSVLDHHNWITISYGGTGQSTRTLDNAKLVADAIF